ncbi:MAG: CCDC90 family protein [Nitrospirae bacterium YQR-1]
MATLFFDTLKVFETLKSSGFSDEQAKGLSDTLKVAQEAGAEHLAAKADLQAAKAELKEDINRLDTKISDTKAEILKWMFIFWASQIGVIFALFKFFK